MTSRPFLPDRRSARLQGALIIGLFVLGAAGCSKGRETRLQDVLNRSRAGPERIVELESPYLVDPDPDVRALAVWAIGDSGAPGAAAAISPLAGDKADAVRLAVAKALCEIAFPPGPSSPRPGASEAGGASPPAGGASPASPPAAVGGAVQPTGNAGGGTPPPGTTGGESQPLETSGPGDAPAAASAPAAAPLEVLTRLAADTDVLTRRVAVRCLVSDPAADPRVLNRALGDTDEDVRRTVLDLLVARPRPGTLPGLVAALRFPSLEDRIEAAKAMRALKDPEALPALESVASEHLPSGVRDVVEPTILELRAAKALAEKESAAEAAKADAEPSNAGDN